MSTSSSSSTTGCPRLKDSNEDINISNNHSWEEDTEAVKGPLGGCAESIMRLFSSSKRKDKNLPKERNQEDQIPDIINDKKKKKKKSFLKRIFKSNKKKKKGAKKKNQSTEGDRGNLGQSPTSRSVTEVIQQVVIENELFKDTSENRRGNAVQEEELRSYSSLSAPLSDFLMEDQQSPQPIDAKQLDDELLSSPLPIYKDDDDDDSYFNDYNYHLQPNDQNSSLKSRKQEQHVESLDVTQELSFESSLSIWTKNSAVKVTKKEDDASFDELYLDDIHTTGDSSLEIYKRDSEHEESEEEKTFNGLFEGEVHALEDTLEELKRLSDQDSSSTRSGRLSRHEDELPQAPPESPPHSSLILPNLSPINPSKIAPSPKTTTIDVPVMVPEQKSNSLPAAPQSPSRSPQLDALGTSTPTALSPISSSLQLKQRTKQDSGSVVNSITRSYHTNTDDEASMSTNNSVYLDCMNQDDAQSTATSIVTADGEVCKNLLVQFDSYSNQYSLGLQIRNLVAERDELLANQQKERELHQANYKAFCEKIQRLEQNCHKQREQRQSLVEQLAHQSVLHRQSVLQLSMLRKQQEELHEHQHQEQQRQQALQQQQEQNKDNPWAELTASAPPPLPVGDELIQQVQNAVQQEGAAILDRFLLDDKHREQLEQQLEDSLNERHQLVAKFGQELGIQLARYKQLEERFNAEQAKYNRQVGLNAQLEQQVFQLKQDYEEMEEKYTHLQDWQAAIIRKHERQQKRASPARGKDPWTSVLGDRKPSDDESDIQIMEA